MSIFPLEQFEKDVRLADEDRALYEKLQAPKTVVVRFGRMKLIGEYPYQSNVTPGCGSKLVVRTHRGVEIGEMLTSTCANAGCSKSVTRQEMLDFIDRSGGRDYPFFNEGKALRVASVDDLNRQAQLDASKPDLVKSAQHLVDEMNLPMRIIEAEPILGGERLTFYFAADERIDFRALVRELAAEHKVRIDMRQVGARDEARLTADYERCGQHCCCKQFLKVLRPVSMRSAKVQKATLDPLKISGRCGRLMCCLRYEDETYEDLRRRLPHRKSRVGTLEGPGIVVSTQILTQLVLVELDNRTRIAVPVEELRDPEAPLPKKEPTPPPEPMYRSRDENKSEGDEIARPKRKKKRRRRRKKAGRSGDDSAASTSSSAPSHGESRSSQSSPRSDQTQSDSSNPKKKKRRRRGRRGSKKKSGGGSTPGSTDSSA